MKDFVILGGGISGMMAALSAANSGFSAHLVERCDMFDDSFLRDYRSTSLTPTSISFLNKIGVWDALAPAGGEIKDIYVLDNKSDRQIHFPSGMSALGVMVKNNDLKKILFDAVKASDLIEIENQSEHQNIEETEQAVHVTIKGGKKLKAKFVIFCGPKGDSNIFPAKVEKDYDQHALTFDVSHAKPHEGSAVEHFMHFGVFALLPLKNPNHSAVVLSIQSKYADLVHGLRPDELLHYIKDKIGPYLGEVKLLNPHSYLSKPKKVDEFSVGKFPLHARLSSKYFDGKKILMASSAHHIHPLAGQGLNQSIKDIECFFDLACAGAGADMLGQYQAQRKGDNYNMYLVTNFLSSIFVNNSSLLARARQLGLGFIDKMGFLKKKMIARASGGRQKPFGL